MESKPFMKVFKDINLFQGKPPLVTNDVDIIFSKYKGKGLKSITFADFEAALGDVAAKKKMTKDALIAKIVSHGGATYTGTKADYVKFHDDKSQYTGVYARGGPTTVDVGRGGMVSDISQTFNRSKADVRGVVKK